MEGKVCLLLLTSPGKMEARLAKESSVQLWNSCCDLPSCAPMAFFGVEVSGAASRRKILKPKMAGWEWWCAPVISGLPVARGTLSLRPVWAP